MSGYNDSQHIQIALIPYKMDNSTDRGVCDCDFEIKRLVLFDVCVTYKRIAPAQQNNLSLDIDSPQA